ncbi:MAG: AI-2E family transporter, partial [Clostridiales bacterium]
TDPTKVIWYLLFTLVLQQVEGNILEPKILSNSLGLSPFWILFAILLGGDLFGFLGMIVGVPIFAVVYSLFKGLVENRLIEKGLPGQTHEYSSQENPVDAQVRK